MEDLKDATETANLQNAMLNNITYIGENWVRETTPNGTRYINPDNRNIVVRLQREGTDPSFPNYEKPYYKIELGVDSDGKIIFADKFGVPSNDPNLTHMILENIAKWD